MNHIARMALGLLVLILAACQPASSPTAEAPTVTPEVYIPLEKAIPEYGIMLEGVHLQITAAVLSGAFPAGCTGEAPACTKAKEGSQILSVKFAPRDLPQGNMLAYKNLPSVSVTVEGSARVPQSLSLYDNASANLTIGFEVPIGSKAFGLNWADLAEIPLSVGTQ